MENYDIVEPVVQGHAVVQDHANKYSKVYRIRAKPLLATHKKTMCVLMGFLDNLYLSGVIDADKLDEILKNNMPTFGTIAEQTEFSSKLMNNWKPVYKEFWMPMVKAHNKSNKPKNPRKPRATKKTVVAEEQAEAIPVAEKPKKPRAKKTKAVEPAPAAVAQEEPAVVAHEEPAVVAQEEPAVVAHEEPAVVAHEEPAAVAEKPQAQEKTDNGVAAAAADPEKKKRGRKPKNTQEVFVEEPGQEEPAEVEVGKKKTTKKANK